LEYIEPNYAICLLEDAVIGDTTGESTTGEGTTGDTVTDSEELWPNDPLCSTGQLGLQGIYGLAGMEQELTGAGVVVGMVDSGVHAAHEDLNAENMSGSNYVSDELPYSVDSYGHGTVVAGVIAAQTNNGVGVAGIAPDAQLRVYRCFNSGKAYTNEVVPAILQAAADGCQVINLSLGTEYNVRSLREAVEEIVASGAVVVAAVGNTGGTAYQYPAAYPGVIGVGSVDAQLQVSSFSQRNDSVVAVAPGEEMTGLGYEEGTLYRTDLRGTSYAAPAVSAMAALALEYDSDITPDGIRYLLETTSADSGDIGYDTDYGWGVVDLEAYLAELKREFSITYELNGGELPVSRTNAIPERFHVTDDDISLPEPTRKFFLFTGWYADEELTQPVEYIPAGSLGDVTLYAGWEANLSLSILGDSISTYTDWSSGAAAETTNSTIGGGVVYYTAGLHGVYQHDTWWQQTADALDLRLLVNNSWSGSCVFDTRSGTTGAWEDRCAQLHDDTGENAGEEPAIIAVFLGTNDFSYYTSQLGRAADIDYDALITQTEGGFTYTNPSTVCEAYAIMLHKMTVRYPDTEIYCMTMLPRRADASVGQPEAFSADISAIAEHFGCYVADLYEDCGIPAGNETFDHYFPDQRVHPNCFGMDAITGTLVSAILENSALLPEDRVLHPVSYNLTDVLVDQGTAKTLLDGTSFSVSLTAPEDYGLEVTVSMGGRDITADCYSDGAITIDRVTGDLSVTARALFSLREHLQNLPDPVYRETNLWTVLTHESGYFMGAEWSANYSSITFPVSEGDQIYANAFGTAGENGGTRVTFFDPYGVNKTMTPDEIYAEYLSNGGYVVAPAGTVAVNVVLWKNDIDSEVRVLNLPHGIHDYQSVITPPSCTVAGYTTHTCTICGDWYNDSEVPMLEHSFTVYHPDSVTGAEVALCDRGCGTLDTQEGQMELQWQFNQSGGITGAEYGIGRMLMALYDEDHRMLAADFCTSNVFAVGEDTVIFRFAPPEFSVEDLMKTAYVVRFSLEPGDSCAPTLQECRFE